MADWPIHGKIDGPIVMIGFGSIGQGTLPLPSEPCGSSCGLSRQSSEPTPSMSVP
jgi:hypothetical protein